jgi:hypothetical protein
MLIRKAYRYRLYPNQAQAEALSRNFGCAKFIYNHFLAERQRYYTEHKADPDKTKSGRYFASVQVEIDLLEPPPNPAGPFRPTGCQLPLVCRQEIACFIVPDDVFVK